MRSVLLGAVAMALVGVAEPAIADVKAGVEAWAQGDYRRAVTEWRGPAVAGDADAQFNMGQAYKLGRGVPVDLAMAEEWYRKAAAQGHPQAEDNYGLALFQNNKRDMALPWLEKSAKRGEPRAQYVLGTMYFNGDVVKRDYVKAYALMTRASAAGLDQATGALAQMDKYIGLKERQQAVELARRYEADAARPQLPSYAGPPRGPASRPSGPIATTPLPPSSADSGDPVAAVPPPARRPLPRPMRPAPAPVDTAELPTAAAQATAPKPRPAPPPPAVAVASRPVARADGGWRIQLGTFRDVNNAKSLFATLQRKGAVSGLTPYLVNAGGGLTRLQSGPFGSDGAAASACAAIRRAGSECVPVRK